MPCLRLYAVSVAEGSLLWQKPLSELARKCGTEAPIWYGDGAIDFQYCYSQDGKQHFVPAALRASVGTPLWAREIDGQFLQVIARGGTIIAASFVAEQGDGKSCPVELEALRAGDGSRVWKQHYAPCPLSFRSW